MLKKIVLGVLLVLWWLPSVHVDAQLDSDYDPFLVGLWRDRRNTSSCRAVFRSD